MLHARRDYDRFQDPAVNDPTLLGEGSTPIAPDEPVFILRAQDKHEAGAVAYYAMQVAKDPDVDPEFAATVARWANRMAKWGTPARPGERKKSPDMPPGAGR